MNKCQAGIFDLAIELIEDLEYEIKHKIKSKPGRPKEENIDNNIQLSQEKKEEENIENNIQLSQEKKEEHIENDFEKSEVKIITTQNETAISEAKVLTQENNLLSEENLDKNQFNISNEIKEIKGMPDEPFAQRDYIFNKKNIRVIKIEEEETQFCPDIFSPFMKKIFG